MYYNKVEEFKTRCNANDEEAKEYGLKLLNALKVINEETYDKNIGVINKRYLKKKN